jgi:hypothetical protein
VIAHDSVAAAARVGAESHRFSAPGEGGILLSVAVLFVLALLLCNAADGGTMPAPSSRVFDLFQTRERVATLHEAEKVQAFRLRVRGEFVPDDADHFAGYPIRRSLGSVDPILAKKLAAALLDGRIYSPPPPPNLCTFLNCRYCGTKCDAGQQCVGDWGYGCSCG